MKKTLLIFGMLGLLLTANVFGQLNLPRESNSATVMQTVGDSKLTITYHRPNIKGRKIWGDLVPFGQPWRAGANDNTTFEFSRDVTINGQALPGGKYGFHVIPEKKQWTLIFNKVNNEWGSFNYKPEQDALRVKVPITQVKTNRETLMYEFESVTARSTKVVISWEKVAVPFTVDVGDVYGRTLAQIREAIKTRKADDVRPFNQGANYVYTFRIADSYNEALGWLDESIKVRESFGNLAAKARLYAEMGKKPEAISTAEKAVQVGKSATPPANPNAVAALENDIKKWKGGK